MTTTHRIPGLVLTDHEFNVPVDHARPDGPTLTVFAREVAKPGREHDDLPWLLFLQGGPGFGSPRPAERSGWLARALEDHRVLLLDQRGTERSSRVDATTLARMGRVEDRADYLSHFRADAIVGDCEAIRRALNVERWTLLGQSYGGFCAVRYLCAAPEALKAVLITGGLPPLDAHPDDVYRGTYERVREKNARFYERYPRDIERVRRVVDHLLEHDVHFPGGGRLTARRFQQLGLHLGMSDGFEQLHYLLEQAFVDGPAGAELSFNFVHAVEHFVPYETNPIYSLLHEAIYAQGFATDWSAQRVRAEFPSFDVAPVGPVLFTGETIYPWMFDDYARLEPLKQVADLLARKDDWPHLYDRAILSQNTVPTVAALYFADMYVDRRFSLETLDAIRGARAWVTNEHEHNGLRARGADVLGRLLDMVRGDA